MRKTSIALTVVSVATLSLAFIAGVALIRPYDVPEFVEVDSSESAFLIPLEGDTANQAAFQSVKFLEEKKVATKRVQITHRWLQTGYLPSHGQICRHSPAGEGRSPADHARMDALAQDRHVGQG